MVRRGVLGEVVGCRHVCELEGHVHEIVYPRSRDIEGDYLGENPRLFFGHLISK